MRQVTQAKGKKVTAIPEDPAEENTTAHTQTPRSWIFPYPLSCSPSGVSKTE